jgi:hypothetical protein
VEQDLQPGLAFERVFRIPVWYVYRTDEKGGVCWHWISALKMLEAGVLLERKDKTCQFVATKIEDFVRVESGADIAKLYTQRMPGYSKIRAGVLPNRSARSQKTS